MKGALSGWLWGGAAFCFVSLFWLSAQLSDDTFASPKSYMSLVRVQQLYENGDWYDSAIHRSNAPYGEQMAASRLFDLVLLIPALAGSFFIGFAKSLSAWGSLVGPVLGAGVLVFFAKAVKPSRALNGIFQLLIMGFVLLPWFLPGQCEPGQLLVLFFAALFYVMSELFRNPTSAKWAYISGAILALAMWVQVESVILILVVHAAFVALWFIGDLSIARIAAQQSRALLAGGVAAFLVERPYGEWMHVELQKISAGHLLVFAILTVIWSIMSTFVNVGRLKRVQERIWWSFRSFLIALFVLFFSFREFISSPLPTYSPEAMLYWYNPIAEKLPLARTAWGALSFLLFIVVVALGFSLYRSIRSGITERRWWVFLTSGIVFFTLFALFKDRRWLAFDMVILLASWISLGQFIASKNKSETSKCAKRFISSDMLLLMTTPFVLILAATFTSLLVPYFTPFVQGRTDGDIKELCAFLKAHYAEGSPRRILAYIDYGPEILYRTRHEVVAIPYGNRKAIYDERAFMFAEDIDLSRIVAQERRIDTVVVTPLSQAEKDHYPAGENFPSMHRRLIAGNYPRWMSPVQLPEAAKKFLLYEISPEILRTTQEPLMRAVK